MLITQTVQTWFKRNFSDPEAVGLFFVLIFAVVLFELFGSVLIPVFASIIIAYLLSPAVHLLEKFRCPRILAVGLVFVAFVGIVAFAIFALLPLLWKQTSNLVSELPHALNRGQLWLNKFAHLHPNFFKDDPLTHIAYLLKQQTAKIGQLIFSFSLATIPSIVSAVIYLVLVPLLVFFFLKDGKTITSWITRFLPSNRGLIQTVWTEVHQKIGAYVRGRVIEILIVGSVSVIAFSLLGMQYAFLMGALVGVSVIIPYIGAVLVTIPVVIIGLMQWGISPHFGYLLAVYAVIITIDANILFPILFSETMDLHPLIIIISVLLFGGIWGFWGVFFAIPLATLIKAILNAWPQTKANLTEEIVTAEYSSDKAS